MIRKISLSVLALVALLLVTTPAFAQGMSGQQPLFTYVSLWGVPRAQWGDVAKVNASNKTVLDPLVADGTLVGYGSFENWVHSDNGYTHGDWFQATSIASIMKALTMFYARPDVMAPVLAASKHMDYLMVANMYGARSFTNASGFLRVVSSEIQPGRMDDFRDTYRRYIVPVYEKLLADGTIVNYQLDSEYVIENAPGRVFSVVQTRDADGLDKVRAAIAEVFDKNPAAAEALFSATVPNSRNDLLGHVTMMTHK